MSELQHYLDFAIDAAWQAGRVTLGYFQREIAVERKADDTPVTMADREAERTLREMIERYWPDHGIVGEEYGAVGDDRRLRWVVDPIDGTKSFIHGVPIYANLVALLDGDEPLLGVINLPALNEMVYAAKGLGCFWNGRPARVSPTSELREATVLSSEFDNLAAHGRAAEWDRLIAATRLHRTWGDAYGYSLVATGRADIMVDPIAALWDLAPLSVVIEEAGGTATDWQGEATIHHGELVATNGLLFDATMSVLRG